MRNKPDAKRLQLMREYALDEAAHAFMAGDWFKEGIFEDIVKLIDERGTTVTPQTVARVNAAIRQDGD